MQEFYEKLSSNYDALQTLEEGQKLQGFVMTTLNKLPQVKPDPVRVDESWEEWSMEDLIDALQKWLRRNHTQERMFDEWDALLERSTYWGTMRVTAWVLRFIRNCKARNKSKKMSGPLVTEEITTARDYWVKRVQKAEETCLKSPGWKLVKDDCAGVLSCEGRIKGYRPIYLPGGLLAEKLILHIHNQVMHLGVANTMASVREN